MLQCYGDLTGMIYNMYVKRCLGCSGVQQVVHVSLGEGPNDV